jgi:phosphopantothenoylcysteine decarboxylase/phosphopantothenate--cysteine ligase
MDNYDSMDAAIAAAAVSDYRPKKAANQKIKKENENLQLELERTPDILSSLGSKKKKQVLVGFALETENEEANALGKLERKNLDFIVLNSLNDEGAGFRTETNKICILFGNGRKIDFGLKSKKEVAEDILKELTLLLNE